MMATLKSTGIAKVDTKGWWMVNSTHIYVPGHGLKIEHTNVAGSSTSRLENGYLYIDWKRRDVRKIYLAYPVLTADELDQIMSLMYGKEFGFTFRDRGQTYNISSSLGAYCSEANYTYYGYGNGYGVNDQEIYVDISMHVIEK